MYDELVKRLRSADAVVFRVRDLTLMQEAADAIESISKAYQMMAEAYEAEVTKSRWIPVTERLPGDNTPVLVVNDDGKVIVAKYEKDIFGWYYKYCEYDFDVWDALENGVITHWMPLPELPKEK